jgi:O-antigen ligase
MKLKALPVLISTTLISLPFYVIRCSNFDWCSSPIPITFLEILILATFLVWFVQKLVSKQLLWVLISLREHLTWPVLIAFLVFLLSGLVAALIAPSVKAGLGIYKAYFIEGFLLFLVIFDYLVSTKNFKLVIWSLTGSGLLISIFAVGNHLLGYNPGNPEEFLSRGRASALYTTSNAVGLLLGPQIILLFGYVLSIKKQLSGQLFEKKLAIVAFLVLFAGLLASGSRGAYFAVFTGLFLFLGYFLYLRFFIRFNRFIISAIKILLVIFFSVIFLFFLNVKEIANKPPEITKNLQASFNQRLCLWDGAVEIIRDRPLFGSGLSGFQQAHDIYRTCSQENSIYPHNLFLNFWTESGIFGLFSFLALCLMTVNRLLKSKVDYFAIGLVGAFVVIFMHGLVDVPFFKNDLSALFWTILALSQAKINETLA